LFEELGKPADAEAAYRAALAIQERLAAEFPAVPGYRSDMADSHHSLGLLLAGLGKRAEAEAAYRAALALFEKLASEHPDVPDYRTGQDRTSLALGGLWVADGKVADAVATADRIAGGKAPAADTLYGCACVFARASAAENNPDADAHAGRAVALVRQAVDGGYRNIPHMLTDADLGPLRRRDDFAALIWDLADGLPAK
jgi:tetratricopeptide (TPR) repeat protein